jgi:tRNA(Ile)-lysidine synthase
MSPPEIAARPGRSHPPSLLRLAERLLRDERLIERGNVVLCACSGGPDSTALLHVLGRLRGRFGFHLAAHGVDHGLRPEAAGELELAERVARALGVPFGVTRVSVERGGNLQARARDARRDALRNAAIAAGARLIATGHTADDRAETFLLRLLRGAGPHGLAVLPPSAPFETAGAQNGGSGPFCRRGAPTCSRT